MPNLKHCNISIMSLAHFLAHAYYDGSYYLHSRFVLKNTSFDDVSQRIQGQ